MKLFGYEDIPEALSGDGINAVDNVLTMDCNSHASFDKLGLWLNVSNKEIFMNCTECLQPVEGQEDTYEIQGKNPSELRRCRANPIALTSQDPDVPQSVVYCPTCCML